MSEPDQPPDEALLEEAAAWFAKMRGPDAEASRSEFDAWLARGAPHRAAYNRAAEIFAMGKVLAEHHRKEIPAPRPSPHALRPPAFTAIAAAVLIVLTTGWLLMRTPSPGPGPATPGTGGRDQALVQMAEFAAPGEPRSVRLADGSVLTLQTGTSVAVALDRDMRRLTLERGSARFNVAHEGRPFIVYAGGGSVTAHGTIFDVSLSRDRQVMVRLLEGAIDVIPPAPLAEASPAPHPQRLHAGETVSFAALPSTPPGGTPGEASMTAGLSRPGAGLAKDYESVTLAELVRVANRTAARPIRLAGPVGQLRVSGKFRIDDTELLSDRLAGLFDLAVDRRDPGSIVLGPKERPKKIRRPTP